MIDIGINLTNAQFDEDRGAVLQRAAEAGLEAIILTATDLPSAAATQALIDSGEHSCVALYTTAGVHPHDAAAAPADLTEQLSTLSQHDRVVAIGEAGLDYHRNFSPKDVQRAVFEQQAALAAALGMPLFVHDRDSNGEVLEILQRAELPPEQVIIHCFTGSDVELDAYLAGGYWIGITGWVCDPKRGAPLRDIVGRIPLERLLIETDAPFLLPRNVPKTIANPPRGRRNEPAYLPYVADTLSELLQVSKEELASRTAENARRAFNLPR